MIAIIEMSINKGTSEKKDDLRSTCCNIYLSKTKTYEK